MDAGDGAVERVPFGVGLDHDDADVDDILVGAFRTWVLEPAFAAWFILNRAATVAASRGAVGAISKSCKSGDRSVSNIVISSHVL